MRGLGILLVALGMAMLSPAAELPNIVFIMADDLGVAELGCYGQEKIKTPHIDKLAKGGMKFTQFYSGSPVCAPCVPQFPFDGQAHGPRLHSR